jgi:hypothetical protein
MSLLVMQGAKAQEERKSVLHENCLDSVIEFIGPDFRAAAS